MNNTTEQIQVQYVNQRNGTRPASIKAHDGRYFTVSDAAIGIFQQDAVGMISYYMNDKGFNIATHWNGQELPKDGRNTGYPQMNVPQNPQQNNAPRANGGNASTTKDKSIILQSIIKSCAAHSGTTEEADMWLAWYAERMRTGVPQQQPQQQNNPFGNNVNAAPPEPGLDDCVPF